MSSRFLLLWPHDRFSILTTHVVCDPSTTRWHLHQIVQRTALNTPHIRTGVKKFDLSTISTWNVIIYVIDSGIQINHDKFGPSRAMHGVNIIEPTQVPADCNCIGTHVADLAASRYS